MALGQGIKDLLKYAEIAKAGAPQNLTGDALVGLGALFAQMDFKIPGGEEEELIDDKSDLFVENGGTLNPEDVEYIDPNDTADEDLASIPIIQGGKKEEVNPGTATEQPKEVIKEEDAKDDLVITPYLGDDNVRPSTGQFGAEGSSRKVQDRQDLKHRLEYEKIDKEIIDPTKINTDFNSILGEINQKEEEELFRTNKNLKNARRNVNPLNTIRLKDENNPLLRLKNEKPEIFEALEGLRYTRRGEDDSPLFRAVHVASSPFTKTDNFDYRQLRRATMPSYAGQIGKAAAEGYNLVIDKYNYDQKVKADYDEEIEDQMGSLDVEADFIGENSRKQFLELSMGYKKELNDAFNAYANGRMSKIDYENVKSGLKSKIDNVAQTNNNLTLALKDFMENKGTFDIDASDSQMVDFYNTLEKNPDSFTVQAIDGVDYLVGETRSGKAVKVPTAKIANGTAGFRLVKKASLSPMISGAVKDINTFGQRTVKTEFGYGTASATPEKAREIGIASLKNKLMNNESDLRSVMAQIYGVNHDIYQSFIGQDGEANKKEMIADAATHLYDTQVKGLVFEQEKTTRFVEPKTGGGVKLTAKERERQQLSSMINKLPTPTESNFSQYEGFIDKRFAYKIDKGNLIIGEKGVKKATIPLNDPNFKNRLAKYTTLPPYVGQPQSTNQDLSQYNFDIE